MALNEVVSKSSNITSITCIKLWVYRNVPGVGLSSNRHQAWCQMASFCEQRLLCYGSFCDHVHGNIWDFTIDCRLEHRPNITFCFELGKSATKTFDMIRHMYDKETMSRAR